MDLAPYIDQLRRDLLAAAEVAGEDARIVAERLVAALEASVRLAMIDALSAAAEEITSEIAPASVEVRVRGREPEFVVSTPAPAEPPSPPPPPSPPIFEAEDGTTARISLRLPDGLKARVEEAAADFGTSVNAWLVRALNDAVVDLNRQQHHEPSRGHRRGRSLSGWVR